MKLSISECKEKLKSAEMILVGVGKEFEVQLDDVIKYNEIYKKFKDDIDSMPADEGVWLEYAIFYHELVSGKNPIVEEKVELLNKLYVMLEGKNIFVISICNHDIIRQSRFNKEKMVSPCGTTLKMECNVGCKKDVYNAIEIYEKIYKRLELFYKDEIFDKQYIMQFIPICEKCESLMELNLLGSVSYSEEGYLDRWEYYQKWLAGSINREIVLLELGVDFDTPTVIRFPFEKINMINTKSTLIRVNEKFSMLTPEIVERATSVSKSSKKFIEELEQV